MSKSESPYDKYRNDDKRCHYPFEQCGVGYCWGYATMVDGNSKYESVERLCRFCECWEDSPNFEHEGRLADLLDGDYSCPECGKLLEEEAVDSCSKPWHSIGQI